MSIRRYTYFLKLITVILFHNCFGNQSVLAQDQKIIKDVFDQNSTKSNPDKIIEDFKKEINQFSNQKDTVGLINKLMELSGFYSHILDYGKSYDGYWDALILADKSNDSIAKAKIYQGLGWMYLFYRRDGEASKYFNLSLELRKELFKKQLIDVGYIGSDYFSLVNLYRTNNDIEKAQVYLDSCIAIQKKYNRSSFYISAEKGYIKGLKGDFDNAIAHLDEASEFSKKNDPAYMIVISYLYAQVHEFNENLDKALLYYKKSLELTKLYHRHTNYMLMSHEAIASLYAKNKMYKDAFYHRNEASILNEKIFGRKSKNNIHLFEIKDKYRIQKEKEKELIKEQRIALLEKDEKLLLLRIGLMAVVLVSMAIYGFLLFKSIKRKHKLEKTALKEKRDLELQKANEILELKNKELTTSALQLIEKEEFLTKLKSNISEKEVDVNSVSRMLKSITGTPNSNWKEFEARFTSINQSFYKKLKAEHPDLGKTDLKICALVKLEFSSKDMSSLLGISIESVHTSRHRLRKKLSLKRDDNLTTYISKF